MVYVLLLFEMLFLLSTACHAEEEKMKRPRARDIGINIGIFLPGEFNRCV